MLENEIDELKNKSFITNSSYIEMSKLEEAKRL